MKTVLLFLIDAVCVFVSFVSMVGYAAAGRQWMVLFSLLVFGFSLALAVTDFAKLLRGDK